MAFVDALGFEIALLVVVAAVFTYLGVAGFLAMRRNDPAALKSVLKGAAIPVGGVGVIASGLGVWGEIAWPLPGSYNILFSDVYLLFGIVLVAFALSAALALKLQYVGVLGLVAGSITMFYGYSGLQLNMTKEPMEMWLLYAGFGAAGIFAFPATLVADRFLHHPEGTPAFWAMPAIGRARPLGTRAAQPVGRMSGGAEGESTPRVVLPAFVTILVLVFPVVMALAGIAAMFFLGSTIPSHLKSAP